MFLVFRTILLAVAPSLLMATSSAPPNIPKQAPKTFPRCGTGALAVACSAVVFLAREHLLLPSGTASWPVQASTILEQSEDTHPSEERRGASAGCAAWPAVVHNQVSSRTILEQIQADTLAHTSEPRCGGSGCAATVTDFSYCAKGALLLTETAFVKTILPGFGVFSATLEFELEKEAYMYGVLETKKNEFGPPHSFTFPELLAVQDGGSSPEERNQVPTRTEKCQPESPVEFDPARPRKPTKMLAFAYDPDYVVGLKSFLEGSDDILYRHWSSDFSKICSRTMQHSFEKAAKTLLPRFEQYTERFKRYLSLELLLRKSYKKSLRKALQDAIEEMRRRFRLDSDFTHHGNMLVASPEVLREGRKPPLRLIDFTDARDIGDRVLATDRAGVMQYMVQGSVLSFERKAHDQSRKANTKTSTGSSSSRSSSCERNNIARREVGSTLTITVQLPGISDGSANELLIWRPEIERWLRSEAVNPEGGLFSEDGQRIFVEDEEDTTSTTSTQIEFRWLWPTGEKIEDVKGDRINRKKPGLRLQDIKKNPLKWTDTEQFRELGGALCDNLPGFHEIEAWFFRQPLHHVV